MTSAANSNPPSAPSIKPESRAAKSKPPQSFRRGFKRLVFSLIPLVVLDMLLTLIVCRDGRLLNWPLPPYSLIFNEEQAGHLDRLGHDPDPYRRFDAELGWSFHPNGATPDGARRANSAGIRAGREYTLEAPAGVLRIGAFGESFTHCHGFEHETWPYLLAQQGSNVEVLNFGVSGFGTDQVLLRYRRDGVAFHPRVVLIGFMLENILRNVSVYRPAYFHGTGDVAVKPRFRLNASGQLELIPCPVSSVEELREAVRSGSLTATLMETDYWVQRAPIAYRRSMLHWSGLYRIVCGLYENLARDQHLYYRNTESEPFRVTCEILRTFRAEALSNGAERVLVVVFPDKDTVVERMEGGAGYWESLLTFLNQAGIESIDLTPALVELTRSEGIRAVYQHAHPTPLANGVIAKTLAERLGLDEPRR
ncbi:MAG: hypothetical protein HOP29_13180 [Phycisphaerales bacterium]|nr:hypothetical protein [Phycisphaerales bacterium]